MNESDFMKKHIVSEHGDLQLPDDENEKMELARHLLGSAVMGKLDYWLDHAKDYLDNPQPAEPFVRQNEAYWEDKYLRDSLSNLDEQTKKAVFKLLTSTTSGALFSLFNMFDEYSFGELKIMFSPKTTDKAADIHITSPDAEEMHEAYYAWIDMFSKYKESL